MADLAEAVELPAEPEGDCRAGGTAAIGDAKAKVLPVTDGLQVGELAAGDKQVDAGVAEPERREPLQLPTETERERRAGDDRVDRGHRAKIVEDKMLVGVGGERLRELAHVVRVDREAGGGAVAAEALEVA